MQSNALHRTPASGASKLCRSTTTLIKAHVYYDRVEESQYETDGYCNSRRLL